MTIAEQISGLLVQLDSIVPLIKTKLDSGLSQAQAQQIKDGLNIIAQNILQLAA